MNKNELIIQLLRAASKELRNKALEFSNWVIVDAYTEAADAIDSLADDVKK